MSNGNTASEWVPTGSVTVRVPGKVNLYLAVGDRRDDGYHELTTVFHAVSLLDEVTVRTADMLSLEILGEGSEGPGALPTDERNLAWQAAELMAEHVGRGPDVAITIEKSILQLHRAATQPLSASAFRWRLTVDCGSCTIPQSSDTVSS